ncbi:MAG: helix-turn-helix domain-containing protein, partial [Desulfovermiculus sp.]
GGNTTIRTDVRILAATNKDLERLVQEGAFREDLYYRLNVFAITLPPLRRRKEDIPLLIDNFASRESSFAQISTQAMHLLMSWHWPGNIRELQNTIQRAAILAPDGQIEVQHLPQEINLGLNESQQEEAGAGTSLDERLAALEKSFIVQALEQAGGVQAKAAELLGIKPRSLWHRVKKYEIDIEQYKKT